MTAGPRLKRFITVYGPGPADFTLTPVDALPEASADVTVIPWGDATAEDWIAPHIRFSFGWDERFAGMGANDITAEACAIAARLLTAAGQVRAAALHPLPLVDFTFQYLVRPLSPAAL